MPPRAKPLLLFLSGSAVTVALCTALGLVLLNGAFDIWQHGELLLKRSRVVPRLITVQANAFEFFLRCAFSAFLALMFISFAVIVAMVAAHRTYTHQSVVATGSYCWPRFAVRACIVPVVFFLAWLALRIGLPLAFQ